MAVYGTLRKGQKAYRLVKGRTSERGQDQGRFTRSVPAPRPHLAVLHGSRPRTRDGRRGGRTDDVEAQGPTPRRMAALDRYERLDPRQPHGRTRATTGSWSRTSKATRVWAYVGSARVSWVSLRRAASSVTVRRLREAVLISGIGRKMGLIAAVLGVVGNGVGGRSGPARLRTRPRRGMRRSLRPSRRQAPAPPRRIPWQVPQPDASATTDRFGNIQKQLGDEAGLVGEKTP